MTIMKMLLAAVPVFFFVFAYVEPSKTYNCTNCMDFADMMQIRREQIMEQILDRLNLKSVPKISKNNVNVASFIMEGHDFHSSLQSAKSLQNRQRTRVSSRLGDPLVPANYEPPVVDKVLITPKPTPEGVNFPVTYFAFDSSLTQRPTVSAGLHVHLRRLHHNRGPMDGASITVSAYERHGNGSLGNKLAERPYIFDADKERNVAVLDIDPVDMQQWLRNVYDPLYNKDGIMGVYVEAFFREHNLVHNGVADSGLPSMSLHLEIEGEVLGRDRRQERICRPEDNNPRCCLYELEIDFADAGWDFVIAPRTYRANMCNGMCEPRQLKANAYADLASSTRKTTARSTSRAVYSPCCHPIEFDDLTIIYVTENNTIHKAVISDLIARKCGCS
uniref:TGF_BETA_2 domain-containing protein n=1 Tax=Steinernema glaseri TaxID=37863 RepID=A0A1I7YL77_9BILA